MEKKCIGLLWKVIKLVLCCMWCILIKAIYTVFSRTIAQVTTINVPAMCFCLSMVIIRAVSQKKEYNNGRFCNRFPYVESKYSVFIIKVFKI
jgi:energy-converting hydrogenase Eha subunit E